MKSPQCAGPGRPVGTAHFRKIPEIFLVRRGRGGGGGGGGRGNERSANSTNGIPTKTADGPNQSYERLRLETWPIDRVIPSPRNARIHGDEQLAEIAGSIRAFGFSNPVLVNPDGDIIAGHGRVAAARKLGMVEVPVIVLSGLTQIQQRQLVLADNRIALNAGWNEELLALELKELSMMGADLATLGFTADELAKALLPSRGNGLTDEDQVPQISEQAVSVDGDIWCLGPHRVACGDSTDARLLPSCSLYSGRNLWCLTHPTAWTTIRPGATA